MKFPHSPDDTSSDPFILKASRKSWRKQFCQWCWSPHSWVYLALLKDAWFFFSSIGAAITQTLAPLCGEWDLFWKINVPLHSWHDGISLEKWIAWMYTLLLLSWICKSPLLCYRRQYTLYNTLTKLNWILLVHVKSDWKFLVYRFFFKGNGLLFILKDILAATALNWEWNLIHQQKLQGAFTILL